MSETYNPEADEISPEDLEAAAEYYDRLIIRVLLDELKPLSFDDLEEPSGKEKTRNVTCENCGKEA